MVLLDADGDVVSYDHITPIGSVIAWAKSISGVPSLPAAWLECNGQTVSDAESPINGIVIPDLNGAVQDSGTATSGSSSTLADTGKAWVVNAYAGKVVEITGGTGSGQTAIIASNTSNTLTITGNFLTAPASGSTYTIRNPQKFLRGDNTSGGVGGEDVHYLTDAEMPSHSHSYTKPGSSSFCNGSKSGGTSGAGANTGGAGSSIVHENRPPFYEVVWIIRIK